MASAPPSSPIGPATGARRRACWSRRRGRSCSRGPRGRGSGGRPSRGQRRKGGCGKSACPAMRALHCGATAWWRTWGPLGALGGEPDTQLQVPVRELDQPLIRFPWPVRGLYLLRCARSSCRSPSGPARLHRSLERARLAVAGAGGGAALVVRAGLAGRIPSPRALRCWWVAWCKGPRGEAWAAGVGVARHGHGWLCPRLAPASEWWSLPGNNATGVGGEVGGEAGAAIAVAVLEWDRDRDRARMTAGS